MGTPAHHHLHLVPIAGDFSDCLSMSYLVICAAQIGELSVQQHGDEPK